MAPVPDKIRAFYGLSRCTQATLTVAQPVLGALIADSSPPLTLLVGVVAAFTGYYSMFAANDVLDIRLDRRRLAFARDHDGFDIDSAGARHPLATGQLRFVDGVLWVAILGLTSLALVSILTPAYGLVSIAVALTGIGYCLLATVTPYKVILAGITVALAASLGWLLCVTSLDWPLLSVFFLWIAAWEIGGRNIPNDWSDVDEDIQVGIKTVPAVFGDRTSGIIIAGTLLFAFLAGIALMVARWSAFGPIGVAGAIVTGVWALILPSVKLLRKPSRQAALVLFNYASLYPPILLCFVLVSELSRHVMRIVTG